MKKSTIGKLLKIPTQLLVAGAILGSTYVYSIGDVRVSLGTVITLWIIGILYIAGVYLEIKNK